VVERGKQGRARRPALRRRIVFDPSRRARCW
jgi:hypothetical protein